MPVSARRPAAAPATPRKTAAAPARKAAAKRAAPVATDAVAAAPKAPRAPKAPKAPKAAVPEAAPRLKQKLVRDSFTLPQADFDLIDQLKARAIGFGRPAKKSELLRAGLQVLSAATDAQLGAALGALVPLKPGRPKKGG